MPEDETEPATREVEGEVCGCPCAHHAAIQERVGFILCSLGGEKLCAECVMPFGDVFKCHESHADGD